MIDLEQSITHLSPEKRALLSRMLQQKRAASAQREGIPRRADPAALPLSFAQQRFWFLDQLAPGSAFYTIPAAVRLQGQLDVAALGQSLNAIVQRHDVLRGRFVPTAGEPVQKIAPELDLALPVIDLRMLPDTEREAEMLRLATAEAQRPFDLASGPLVRASLLCLDRDDYVLLLSMHHIVADGWSIGVLVQELGTGYAARVNGQPVDLPELPIQYADFADWQRRWFAGEYGESRTTPFEQQLAYWKEQLHTSPALLELPTDRPRPPARSLQGAQYTQELPHELCNALQHLSRQEDATLFMTLLAAFQVLLYRYSGAEDIAIGTPIANRTRVEVEPLIGCFVNTLVMRTDLSGEPGFRDMLRRVRETALAAYAHQDVPFDRLVEELQPERDVSYTPLFQVLFDLQPAPLQQLQLPGLSASLLEIERGSAKFDLSLAVEEQGDTLLARWEYSTDLFDAATIARMTEHFGILLRGIVADPDQSIATLPLLSDAERWHILEDWNQTTATYPTTRCFHHLFEEQVERTPDALAVVFEDQRLTYADLNTWANQLAHYLRRHGVGPEVLVGLCLDRSVELIVGLLGILKAGGAYVPLDPAYPAERLAMMLEDTAAPVVLSRAAFRDILPDAQARIICLDSDWPQIARECGDNPASQVTAANLAYIIYTSGSTGRPKGVMIEHRMILHLASALQQAIYAQHPGGPLRVSLNAPLAFDASVQQLTTLLSGHTLYIIPQAIRRDAQALLDYLRRQRLDVFDCVPSQLKLLLTLGLLDGTGPVPSIILPGGEALDATTWHTLARAATTTFYNLYGPTECTVDSTTIAVHTAPERPTIGRPLANVRLYILDQHLQPVPIGVAGEIYIGGAGVARGYWQRPDLTREKFIPDPFNQQTGARLYRSGDLGRYLPDGTVEFLGRIDHQVKLRGFRIELGEIEALLRQHNDLRDVAVLVQDDQTGGQRLVAYIVPERQPAPTAGELAAWLGQKLPDYMLPALFVTLEALPLTPNGKLDRNALPRADGMQVDLSDGYVAPRTPVEELLAGIWTQILGVTQVGISHNFFDLGGHSLLATRIVSRIRDVFDLELPLRLLFEQPTLAGLASVISQEHPSHTGRVLPPIMPVARDSLMPLSFAQQRLWFLYQLEPDSPLYNIAGALRLRGTLDLDALHQTLQTLVQYQESLRTTFTAVDGRPFQVISAPGEVALPLIDLTDVPAAEQERMVQQVMRTEAQRPFDLSHGPLWRITLLKLAADEHVLLILFHHIISDGWSQGVITRQIARLYRAYVQGQAATPPDVPVQYADFACWQRQWLQGDVRETLLAYWQQQLAGSSPLLDLPTDHPRPAVQSYQGARVPFLLAPDLSAALHALCRQTDVTLFMTLLAAFKVLLYRYSGQDDINVGTPIANRTRSEVEELIGCFINTLVIRTRLSGDLTFRDLLMQVRETTLEAYAHQDLPFEMVVDALQPERDISYTPLFQVMFVLQNVPTDSLESFDLRVELMETDSGVASFDLTLSMEETPAGIKGVFEYNTDMFEAATIMRMIGHFATVLEGIVAQPDMQIGRVPLLTAAECHQILYAWNETARDYPDQCIQQLFEAQVERTPDALAVAWANQHLSYRELNRRANQLAHYLKEQGAGRETLVGICVERSPEMIIGILGILKAGAAYVPFDPAYPARRLAFMLHDSQVPFLLTHKQINPAQWTDDNTIEQTTYLPKSIYLDRDWPAMARYPHTNPHNEATPENLAYVIYTSGSTGKPKGVLVPHRGVANLASVLFETFAIRPDSRILQFAASGFDASISEIIMALLAGATLCLADQASLTSGIEVLNILRDQAITTVTLPPSLLAALPAEDLPALRTVVSAGESCPVEVAQRWSIGRRFLNGYGPTEATVAVSYYLVDHIADHATTIPIGRPIANTQLYILDEYLQPVPIGVPGEMYIGGVGVTRGYLNRPDLTAERFIAHPFTSEPGARLYKTGDLGRFQVDGTVEFLGRRDNQVKIRGFRIELGEIETALGLHHAVQEAVVLAREDLPGHRRLIAYIVPAQNQGIAVDDDAGNRSFIDAVRTDLKDKLPDYMVPATFVLLNAFPLTTNGKVDRKALPAPEYRPNAAELHHSAPRTPVEQSLLEIWSQVLGREQISIHDNFFELGGDSILSIQIIARARQAGIQIAPKQFFQNPTIAELATLASVSQGVQAEQGVVQGSVPLTPIQHWFFESHLAHPDHWNQSLLLEVLQPLDRTILTQTIQHLLAHHDALRLRFLCGENGWQQEYASQPGTVPLTWLDLSALPVEKQHTAIERIAAETQTSLDITQGPLLRVVYFQMGDQAADRLLLVVHHLAIDGYSWRILLEDLQEAYRQLGETGAVQLPPKTTSFQVWARRLVEYAQSSKVQQERDYWLDITNQPATFLPVDFQGSPNTEASTHSVQVTLDASQTRALLQDVPLAYNTDINDVLAAALVQALARWTGRRAWMFAMESHGREAFFADVDVSRTVGWFTALFPVFLDLRRISEPGDMLKAVKEQLRRIPERGTGYGLLRYLATDPALRERLGTVPQADICLNYLGQYDHLASEQALFRLAHESRGAERSPGDLRSHVLDITAWVVEGHLQIEWTYSINRHRHTTIERVAHDFIAALHTCIAHCQSLETAGYTPTDFPDIDLGQDEIELLMREINIVPGEI